MRALRAANPGLVAMLRAQISNTSDITEGSLRDSEREIDGVLLDVEACTCARHATNFILNCAE